MTQQDQLSATESKSVPEFSNQRSAFFKSLVESGCMACKTSTLSGSAFGLTLVYRCSVGTELQPTIILSTLLSKSNFMGLLCFSKLTLHSSKASFFTGQILS